MARVQWQLRNDRPVIQVMLALAPGGQKVTRTVLADTGAGAANDPFEFVLDEIDCLLCGGTPLKTVTLGGAFTGVHPIYAIPIEIPALNFSDNVLVVGVAAPPTGFDGIACFRFLNRFTYGNFGDKNAFGLET
ncbi:MAG: hypothetical protein HY289_06735 [Planctomycetes bacterium]|nr:hypothetical protein [Planctomycetota bacterium]